MGRFILSQLVQNNYEDPELFYHLQELCRTFGGLSVFLRRVQVPGGLQLPTCLRPLGPGWDRVERRSREWTTREVDHAGAVCLWSRLDPYPSGGSSRCKIQQVSFRFASLEGTPGLWHGAKWLQSWVPQENFNTNVVAAVGQGTPKPL